MNILAVDDEETALEGLETVLRRALPGADIHPFLTGADALAFAEHTPCAVAFLDIELRDINGLELALLVDRKGAILNTEQICATLFEDAIWYTINIDQAKPETVMRK